MEVALKDAVSRVTIDQEKLRANILSRKRKHDLRVQLTKEYIQTKQYGQRIKTQEFQGLLQFKTDANTWQFIEKMVKRGEIIKHEITPRTFFYTVPGEVHVSHPADKLEQNTLPEFELQPEEVATESEELVLDTYAMRYLYYYPDGDVRGFVTWLKSQGV